MTRQLLFFTFLLFSHWSYSQTDPAIQLENHALWNQIATNTKATIQHIYQDLLPKAKNEEQKTLYHFNLGRAYLQQGRYDSAYHYLSHASYVSDSLHLDYIKAYALTQWSIYNFEFEQLDDAFENATEAAEIATSLGDSTLFHFSQILIGEYSCFYAKDEKGVKVLNQAKHYFEQNKSWAYAATALNILGYYYYQKDALATSVKCIEKAQQYVHVKGFKSLQNKIEANMGFVLLGLEDYENAYQSLIKSIKLSDFKGDLNTKGLAANTLAKYFYNNMELDSALHFAQLGYDIGTEISCQRTIALSSFSLGSIYFEKQDYPKAHHHIDQTLAIGETINNSFYKGRSYFEKGRLHFTQQQFQLALKLSQKALEEFKILQDQFWKGETHLQLAKITEAIGQVDTALQHNKAYQVINKKIQEENQTKKIAIVQQQFQLEKQQDRIEQLEQQSQLELANSRKNKIMAATLAGLLGLAVVIFLLAFRQKRLKLKKEVAEMKQQLLRLQMNPHFVFNSLNSIQNQLLKGNTESSILLMGKFSRLMRQVLNNSDKTFVSIEKELELLRIYLDLEQIRTNHKFDYEIRIDQSVDIYNEQMPSMISQVFVENAIWHGIAPKKDKGSILLDLKKEKGSILFSIVDNGIGRKYSLATKTNSQKNHQSLGTQLVKQRIKQINQQFSKNIKLLIEDKNDASNRFTKNGQIKNSGTSVHIVLS